MVGRVAVHKEDFVDIVAKDIIRLNTAGAVILGQHLPVVGIVIQGCHRGHRVIRGFTNAAAKGIVGIKRHVNFRLAVEFKDAGDPVLAVIDIPVAVFVLGEISGVVVGQRVAGDGRIAVGQGIDGKVDRPLAPQGLIARPVAQVVHHKAFRIAVMVCHRRQPVNVVIAVLIIHRRPALAPGVVSTIRVCIFQRHKAYSIPRHPQAALEGATHVMPFHFTLSCFFVAEATRRYILPILTTNESMSYYTRFSHQMYFCTRQHPFFSSTIIIIHLILLNQFVAFFYFFQGIIHQNNVVAVPIFIFFIWSRTY